MRKINIHLKVDDAVVAYARSVNAQVRAVTPSIVVFDDTSPMQPHITLAMGYLQDNVSVDDICVAVEMFAKSMSPLALSLSAPHVLENGFVFSDVSPDNVSILKQNMTVLMADKLQDLKHADKGSHLTLGWIEQAFEAVADRLKTYSNKLACTCRSIEISDAGPKGTCVKSLAVFPLGQHD